MTDHDPRCERSAAKRCRCDCGGRLHGAALEAVRLAEQRRPGELYPGFGDDLKRAREQMAHWFAQRGAPA